MTMELTNTRPTIEFLHKAPDYEHDLSRGVNIAISIGSIASRLTQELRTRTIHPDGRRENVSEHSHMLTKIAVTIAQELYPWLDVAKVAHFTSLHDDPEAYVGDTPTDSIAAHDPVLKALIEGLGVEQLTSEYSEYTPSYTEAMNEYEEQVCDEARFARIVDKFTVLLIHIPNEGDVVRKSYTYEEFVNSTRSVERKLLDQYPEWIELIRMRTELAMYIGNKYIRDWTGPVQERLF